MKMYVGITDYDWFNALRKEDYDEINFWRPSGKTNFRALKEGELFLFKLHSPLDYIVGGGIFINFSILPSSLAWKAFGSANGAESLSQLNKRVYKYKKTTRSINPDPHIGCIILSSPFYFAEKDWIPAPLNWSKNIVQGKTYDTNESIGLALYEQVQLKLTSVNSLGVRESSLNRYGKERIIKPRIGQGAFKVLIADAYHRRCAVTGEKTLPVLEAAHIKPYSLHGPHSINNGLLLRSDIHTLLDRGYMTIDIGYHVIVSKRIKEDFGNGKEYYTHHGKKLIVLPDRDDHAPNRQYLQWHNENVYLG